MLWEIRCWFECAQNRSRTTNKNNKPSFIDRDVVFEFQNSTLNFGIPPVLVYQLEVYYKVDRLLTALTAQQKGTTTQWYSNKTSLFSKNTVLLLIRFSVYKYLTILVPVKFNNLFPNIIILCCYKYLLHLEVVVLLWSDIWWAWSLLWCCTEAPPTSSYRASSWPTSSSFSWNSTWLRWLFLKFNSWTIFLQAGPDPLKLNFHIIPCRNTDLLIQTLVIFI